MDLVMMGYGRGDPLPPPCRCWCGCYVPSKRRVCLFCQMGYHGTLKECEVA